MIDTKKLKEIANKSTKVVAWYPHRGGDSVCEGATVRGPFFRWFQVLPGNDAYQDQCADSYDEAKFAAEAMNNLVPLCDEVDLLREQLRVAVDALRKAKSRYWERCYDGNGNTRALTLNEFDAEIDCALQKIEAMKGGQNGSN